MKILVTGGTTFVSKYVAEYFVKKGNEVYVVNRNTREQVRGVHLIECDRMNLGDELKDIKFDAVLDVSTYNSEQMETLLDALGKFDDYIFISSSAVYPETNAQPFSEEQQCGKNSVWGDYGFNKLKAEELLCSRVQNAYILRPPYFYGVYENLYREGFAFDCAQLDRPFYIPENGDMKLQFFSVKDLCIFIEIILEKHPQERIFNVGNKESVTIKEWAILCYKAVGKEPEFVSVPKSVSVRDYFPFYDYEYTLDVTRQSEIMEDTTPLFDGLKEEYEWYKNNKDSIYNRKPYLDFIDNNLK